MAQHLPGIWGKGKFRLVIDLIHNPICQAIFHEKWKEMLYSGHFCTFTGEVKQSQALPNTKKWMGETRSSLGPELSWTPNLVIKGGI